MAGSSGGTEGRCGAQVKETDDVLEAAHLERERGVMPTPVHD